MFALFGWLLKGKAHLKQQLALHARLDPALLPYNSGLITWLHEQKRLGRRLILATAADHVIADAVAKHIGLFDEVIASDGLNNLRGSAKAEAISRHLDGQPYAYAGNDFSDLRSGGMPTPRCWSMRRRASARRRRKLPGSRRG